MFIVCLIVFVSLGFLSVITPFIICAYKDYRHNKKMLDIKVNSDTRKY